MYTQVQHPVDPRVYGAYAQHHAYAQHQAQAHAQQQAVLAQQQTHAPQPTAQQRSWNAVNQPQPQAHPSYPAPPAPPGVNFQAWQTGRWIYDGPPPGQQPYAAGSKLAPGAVPYPPPSAVGWNVPAAWGVPAQYYHPSQLPQKQRDPSYWNTQLTNNGLMLEGMDKPSNDKAVHTPWRWEPSLPEEEPSATPSASATVSSSRMLNSASTTAAMAQGQPPQTIVRPSVPSQSQPPPQLTSAPERSESPRPLYVEDPAQKHARETAPRMYPTAPLSSASSQAQAHAATRASAPAQATAPRPAATAAPQPLSTASAQAATQQVQRTHVPSPHVAPPSQAQAPAAQRQRQRSGGQSMDISAPTPSRPGEREAAYSERRELRTTFSPKIIRTPKDYERGSETPRAAASASANPPAGGALQRSQTLPEIAGTPSGPAPTGGIARQHSMPVASASASKRERSAFGSMFVSLANFAEEPETTVLSPLVDSKSLFGSTGSDADEGSGSSTVSDSTVVEEEEFRPRGMRSFAHAAEVIRASASGGSVPRAERVREQEREERDRQSSGSSNGSGREQRRREKERERERDREREAEATRAREREEREREERERQEREKEERESRRREKESRRMERERARTRSRSRYPNDTDESERDRGGGKGHSSRPPVSSTSYGYFYTSPAAGAESSRMERSTSYSSEDASSAPSTHHHSPYHRSPKDNSTPSSSSHGTPASLRQRTPSSGRASSRPPSLQPSPNRAQFSTVPSPHIAPPVQTPAPYHPAQAHPKPTTPSPNAFQSPSKPTPSSSYPYGSVSNHAAAQANALPSASHHAEPSQSQAQPAAQYSNGAITYASDQVAADTPSRQHRDRDRAIEQPTTYGHRGADAFYASRSAAKPADEHVSQRLVRASDQTSRSTDDERSRTVRPEPAYASRAPADPYASQPYSSASAAAAAHERERSHRRATSAQAPAATSTSTPAKPQASPSRHAAAASTSTTPYQSGSTTPQHPSTHYNAAGLVYQPGQPTPAAATTTTTTPVRYPYAPQSQATAATPPRVRKGYWNRRGDHLTAQGYIVRAPKEHANPPELAAYPVEGQGFRNHRGMVANNPGYRELPDSRAPGVYEKYISYVQG